MIDIKLLLNNFDEVKKLLLIKKVDEKKLEEAFSLAKEFKTLNKELEDLRCEHNAKSKIFFQNQKNENNDLNLKSALENLKSNISNIESSLEALEAKLNEALLNIPNIPDERTPEGNDENDNVVLDLVLEPPVFDFLPKAHWELTKDNKWIDFECGVKLAKSRFSVLKNEGAKLNRALINFMLDHNASYGFSEVSTPLVVNRDSLITTGQLPKFADDMFKIEGDEFYLISTSEITLTNLFRDVILKKEDLPIQLTAYTPCFRKEAGSASKDTRGMIRQHQFDKVELVALTTPQDSSIMQDKMIECASGILKKLNLAHRLVQLCGGDLGFCASNTVDIEVWLPGQNRYREISSISNTRDFQARRGKIRFKDNKKSVLAHTLNGSSLAVGRTLIAIMENYQNDDGSICIPQVLRKYMT